MLLVSVNMCVSVCVLQGQTALHLAARYSSPLIVQLLLTYGADPKARTPKVRFWLSSVHALNVNLPCSICRSSSLSLATGAAMAAFVEGSLHLFLQGQACL